jgi:dCTP deaminase
MPLSNMYGPPRVLVDSDYHAIGKHLITPFDPERVQPASYDVTLGPKLLTPWGTKAAAPPQELDLRITKPASLMVPFDIGDGYVLHPRQCALAATAEQIHCPSDMVCHVDGKSTLGRCFLAVHVTAGFVDPGFVGVVTLELVNHSPWDFVLYEGMKIGQLRFHWLAKEASRPYGSPGLGSHYQGSLQVRAAESPDLVVVPKRERLGFCEGCD